MAGVMFPWTRPVAKQAVQLAAGLSGVLVQRPFQNISKGDNAEQVPPWVLEREAHMNEFEQLKKNNQKWAEETRMKKPDFFEKQAESQQPKYLWVGCSDARVPAETLTGLKNGEIFVHRNIANLVVNTDMNMLSVLTYAVEHLKVRHIVVCGHYQCGGVKAATQRDQDLGVIEHWLRNIRDVQRLHNTELMSIMDPEIRYRRLVELNVAEQCINLFKTGVVQQSRIKTGFPLIHGLVYEIKDGLLKEMNLDLLGYMRQYKSIYKLYDESVVGDTK